MEPLASWILDQARVDDDEVTFVAWCRSGRADVRLLGARALKGVAHPPEVATLDRYVLRR